MVYVSATGDVNMKDRIWISNKLNVYSWWATVKHSESSFLCLFLESKINDFILFKRTRLFSTLLTYTRRLFFPFTEGISLWKCLHKIFRDEEYILAQSKLPYSEEKLWCLSLGALPPQNSPSSHLIVYSFISWVEVESRACVYLRSSLDLKPPNAQCLKV